MAQKKALIIEDEDSWLDLLSLVLKDADFTAMRAATAHEAMKIAKRQKLDLVIIDLGLPDGSGVTLLKALQELPACRDLPILVLSAYHREEVSDIELGDAVFLSKDQGLPPLLAAISAAS